jgi:hypothetical protein
MIKSILAVAGVALVIFLIWAHWYYSPAQELRRCLAAQAKQEANNLQPQTLRCHLPR